MRCRDRWLALVLCALALAVRLWGLGEAPLWLDEAFSWHDARESLGSILGARVDVHPPLYYGLLHLWLPLAGDREYALRLPAALVSVLAVPAAWRLGAVLLGPARPGLAATSAALVALSPAVVAHAREARMYALALALGLLALALAERVVAAPSRPRWALYGLGCLLALASHYTALAAVGAAALRLALAARRVGTRAWLLVHALVGAVAAAWALHLWSNRDAWLGLVWHPWAGPTAPAASIVDWASAVAGSPLGPVDPARLGGWPAATVGLVLACALIGLAAGARGASRWVGGPALALALAALALVPLATVLAAEAARPSWNLRYTLVGLPGVLILAAAGAAALPRWLGWPLALLLVAAQIPALPPTLRPERENWPAVAALIGREGRPDDLALGAVEPIAAYYLGRTLPVAQRPIALGRPPEEVVAELDAQTRGRARVWLVPARDPLLDPADLVGTILSRYAEGRQEYDPGGLGLTRLDLRPRESLALGRPLRPLEASFGGAVQLLGYAAGHGRAAGAPVADLALALRLERHLGEDYKLFAHLLDADGQTVAQQDVLLVDSVGRPTSQLDVGARLRVDLAIAGPPERIARGRAIGIGLYQLAPPGARLPLEPAAPEHRLVLPLAE